MRFEIAVHAQRGRMRSDLSQQPTFDEKPQVVVDRGERNGWNATPDHGVNVFRGIVSVGSDDGLIDHLTLVRDRQAVLCGQLTELFMGEAHDYRIRIIIKLHRAVSTEILPLTSKAACRKTGLCGSATTTGIGINNSTSLVERPRLSKIAESSPHQGSQENEWLPAKRQPQL